MLTLDDAIKHCKEKAEELYNEAMLVHANPNDKELDACIECAREHEQLAEWLTELKAYKEASKGDLISRTELKKCAIPCEIHNGALTDLCVPLYQIDNALTIKDRSLEIAQKSIELGRRVGQLEGNLERPQGEYVDISKLRLMTVEECAGHTIDYAMGWKACIEWIKKGGVDNEHI